VEPLTVGQIIVATIEPHDVAVLAVIREMGLELQVVYNKGSVMVLPSGINKSTGLIAALTELGLSPENAVGVGDGENDHSLLDACALGVAVANAVPSLKKEADWTTAQEDGKGVEELIDRLLFNDLADIEPRRGNTKTGDIIHKH
jgi:hydroxymethylpyrimidine pyrophosphatase-like HAD family hydrolase